MTISITDPRMIDRQHRMQGCGVSPAMVSQMIEASDDDIAKAIAAGEARIAELEGNKLDLAKGILAAFKIEADLRK